jgi:diguanylate cyclase
MSNSSQSGIGPSILSFLDDHRLDHTPLNYAFAHCVLTKEDAALTAEVKRITDGGVRIVPSQVDKLWEIKAASNNSGQGDTQLDRLTLRVLDIISEAASATGELNRGLVGDAASLLAPDGASVRSIIAAMIERTARAEASFAGAARQAQELRDELNAVRNDANRDRLTGLLNRAAIEELMSAAVVSPKGCAIAFLDVDRFKSINDKYGHGVGDRVLKVVAQTLAEACSPHPVARWGGEEFLVLLQDTIAADAGAIVDAARTLLSQRQLKLRENDTPLGTVSFSAGVLSSRGRTVAEMVAGADALLYKAKNAGRNRVEVEPVLVELRTTSRG